MGRGNAVNQNRRFPIWIFPIFGVIIGFVLVNIHNRGLLTIWEKVPNPPEKIVRIIGNVDGYNLLVETISGETIYVETSHCVIYDNQGSQRWVGIQTHPEQNYSANYLIWPLWFQVKQYYNIAYFADGPKALMRFALSENGDLWIWNFCDNGYLGLNYCLFPLIGLFGGGILAVIIIAFRRLTRFYKHIASGKNIPQG